MRGRLRQAALILCTIPALAAAQSGGSESDLARANVNPIGKLKSVPVELTSVSGGGLDGQASNTLTFKPVVPTDIGMGVMLVIRTLVPFVNAPGSSDSTRLTGLGDINPQFYFTRAHPASVVWGMGPGFSLPTASSPSARTGDWGMGPVAAAIWQTRHWSIGAIVTQTWTIAHDGDGKQINQFTVQPLLHWHFAHAYTVSSTPTMKANWQDADVWTVPLGAGLSKVTTFGHQPVSLGAEFYRYYHTYPSSSGSSELKMTVSFLFPTPATR